MIDRLLQMELEFHFWGTVSLLQPVGTLSGQSVLIRQILPCAMIKTTVAIPIEDSVWAHRARRESGHGNNPASVEHAAELPVPVRGTNPVGESPHIPGPNGHSSRTVRYQVRDNFSGECRLTGVVRHVRPSLRASEKQWAGRIRHSTFGQTIVPESQKQGMV